VKGSRQAELGGGCGKKGIGESREGYDVEGGGRSGGGITGRRDAPQTSMGVDGGYEKTGGISPVQKK